MRRCRLQQVDVAINSSLRTISGCLKPTPVFQLPVLAGIAPAGLRRKAATLALARKAVKDDWHILHDTTKNEVPPCRLKSRKPYNKEAQEMLSVIPEDRSKDAWIVATWKQEWEASGPTRVHRHVSDPEEGVKGEELSRKHWTTLNRLRTGVCRYRASMKKRGLADCAACECGEPEQTADHIINSCPLHRPPSEAGLFEVGPLTRAWLQQSVCLSVCMSVCLSVCMSVCLSVCLAGCLSGCLSDCLTVWLSGCLAVCVSVCMFVCLSVCLSGWLSIWMSI